MGWLGVWLWVPRAARSAQPRAGPHAPAPQRAGASTCTRAYWRCSTWCRGWGVRCCVQTSLRGSGTCGGWGGGGGGGPGVGRRSPRHSPDSPLPPAAWTPPPSSTSASSRPSSTWPSCAASSGEPPRAQGRGLGVEVRGCGRGRLRMRNNPPTRPQPLGLWLRAPGGACESMLASARTRVCPVGGGERGGWGSERWAPHATRTCRLRPAVHQAGLCAPT